VTGLALDDAGVDVQVSDGGSLRAEYLVGCEDRVQLIDAQYVGTWELPAIGTDMWPGWET
jgi:hypothetical protein